MNIFWHDGHSLCVYRANINILKQFDHISLDGNLKGFQGRILESSIG